MAGVPANAQQIWDYLIGQGFTNNAAAGILGNIEQESGGDPTAGVWPNNYGVIQWTPAGNYFSSPPSLAQQLPAIMSYINANGSVADINAHASSASEAALYFSEHYERPNAAEANNENRQESADLTLQAAQQGWKMSTGQPVNNPNPTPTANAELTGWSIPGFVKGFIEGNNPGNDYWLKNLKNPVTEVGKGLSGILTATDAAVTLFSDLFKPQLWLRVGAFLVAIIALVGAGYCFVTAEKNA